MKRRLMIIIFLLLGLMAAVVMNRYERTTPPPGDASKSNSTPGVSFIGPAKEGPKQTAPDFTLRDMSGKEVSLKDFRGKKVFLNFWATWCSPCRSEMPDIEKLYESVKNSDVVVLEVDLGENKIAVQNFLSNNHYTFQVLLDSDQEAASLYKIDGIPTTYFIDRDGNIAGSHTGVLTLEAMKAGLEAIH